MPTKTRKRTYRKKRTKKKYYKKRKILIPKSIAPNNRLIKMKYNQVISLDPAVGAINYNRFRLNNLFDPNYETGGGQFRQFDECLEFYKRWTVLGAKITVYPFGPNQRNSSSALAACWGITLLPSGTTALPFNSFKDVMETRIRGRKKFIQYEMAQNAPIVLKMSMRKHFNQISLMSDPSYSGTATSGPATVNHEALAAVFLLSPTGEDISGYKFSVNLEAIVRWTEPKYITES